MDFIEELRWRGMLQDQTPGVEEHLKENKKVIGYIGFDPTAPSITIGNYVQVMILKLFQLSGHQPIVLMGGATGRIGDPSGKDEERQLKPEEELDHNLRAQVKELKKFLDFEGDNKAIVVNNLDFYKHMNVLDFLRNVGKVLTVNYMMSKESVKNRMETGISFTEFSYQLLQAHDFQKLYEKYNCTMQMGGSDQWGNITAGTEFIRRNLDDVKVHAVTTPLLTKSDGTKFGKSTKGNIWISADHTSPYRFYQFWINADDADLPKFLKYFSLKPREEIIALINESEEDPRAVKEKLADELTKRVHSKEALTSAKIVSEFLFNPKAGREELENLSKEDLKVIAEEIPSRKVERSKLQEGVGLLDLMAEETDIAGSKGEARRLVKGNAVSINKEKVQDIGYLVDSKDFIHQDYILLDKGKKNKFVIEVV